MIRRASLALVLWACSALGMLTTAPALMRLMLPLMNALGLLRSMATSIWSSEMPVMAWAAAMRPAVSPVRTVTLLVASVVPAVAAVLGALGAAVRGCER